MIFIILILLLSQPALAQRKNMEQQRQDLKKIREEIERYKKRIENESAKEKSILDMSSALEREIDLTHGLLGELKSEEHKNSKAILDVAYRLKEKRLELEKLQEIYKRRLLNFYKYGRVKDIELLVSSKSFNQVLVWIKYQKLLTDNDHRNYQNIMQKKTIIEAQKDRLKDELLTKRQIIQEKTQEERNLTKRKKERGELLNTIRQNKQLYVQRLQEYEISAREIERLISMREEKRIATGDVEETQFPRLKGRMIWPTNGEIITQFGKNKHPQLNTMTESIGIDIRAKYGEEVRAVGNGVVTAITWQRGRGNIVIVNHFGGYYTVYTHLSKIFVQVDNRVSLGDVIGEIGDSGSMRGPMLHFEIWRQTKVLNPSEWLS